MASSGMPEAAFNIVPLGELRTLTEEFRKSFDDLKGDGLMDSWKGLFTDQEDVFDFLELRYHFQKDNVKNQREHLAMLLDSRKGRKAALKVDESGKRKTKEKKKKRPDHIFDIFVDTFRNYEKWCSYLNLKPSYGAKRSKALELLLVSLYFLIWGEAANLRFMPECLCYLFHQLSGHLFDKSEYWEIPSFLESVIKPVYEIVFREANIHKKALQEKKSRLSKAAVSHRTWRNYDDLNECFWSSKVAAEANRAGPVPSRQIRGEPVRPSRQSRADPERGALDTPKPWDVGRLLQNEKPRRRFSLKNLLEYRQRKTLFVEHRTFLHIYHSFHRLWMLHVLMLQGLAIVAFDKSFDRTTAKNLLSLGPTYALMQFFQSFLDVWGLNGAYYGSPGAFLVTIYLRFLLFGAASAGLTYTFIKIAQEGLSPPYLSSPYLVGYLIILVVFISVQLIVFWFSVKYLKEEYFVGREMRQLPSRVFRYSFFWMAVLVPKFSFSYFFQIKPLAAPTKQILSMNIPSYLWHDFISQGNHNALTVLSLWAPVIMVYFLDTEIWYTVISSLVGCYNGGRSHIGEIRSLGMFMEHFPIVYANFRKKMIASHNKDRQTFEAYWNMLITKLREEDYLSDKEREYLWMPISERDIPTQWPLLLFLNRMQVAREGTKEDWASRQIREYTKWCLKNLLSPPFTTEEADSLLENDEDFKTCRAITSSIRNAISLPQDIANIRFEIPIENGTIQTALRQPSSSAEAKFVERLDMLLTSEESDILSNREAIRRLIFFGNSLFMKMPNAPSVDRMTSFSVLTPHYDEEILFSLSSLEEKNKDGITLLYYLQTVYPSDWLNFLERRRIKKDVVKDLEAINWECPPDSDPGLQKRLVELEVKFLEKELDESRAPETTQELSLRLSALRALVDGNAEGKADGKFELEKLMESHRDELCKWASYRGQTLARTVRGMMYYREAINLQHEQETRSGLSGPSSSYSSYERADAKFTYVVSSQRYAHFKSQRPPHSEKKPNKAGEIEHLMKSYPSLRVAFFHEEDVRGTKHYYSSLIKSVSGDVQLVYRIELPGDPVVGEGKPENQNHAIIFTRGDAIQAIDMNQDNYFEEALKMRNLLEEFKRKKKNPRARRTLLGLREHVFTGSISSLAWFMSNQELSFVTLGQRVTASPLRVRMHYGHPDVFDRLFHITRGGISKASKTINLSEDIFAGFNTTLRGGNVTHHEYIQVGKGRDLGLNQISTFEAKISSGNGEQLLSRDVYRLGRLLDFFRMMSFYYTSVGYYITIMLTLLSLYAYLYGKVYLALSGVEHQLLLKAQLTGNVALESALSAQLLFQIGAFTCLPMVLEYFLEYGFSRAVQNIVMMQLTLSSVFFVFSLGTRGHYFGRTILHGGAKYGKTGRGFVIEHIRFSDNYRLYSRSHFVKGLEIVMLLIVYRAYGTAKGISYILMSIGNWFLALSWLFAPYIFNPLGFEWQKTVDDLRDWSDWLQNTNANDERKSWLAWWENQYKIRTLRSMAWETVLSLRFFMIQYGVSFRLAGTQSLVVYFISWLAFFVLCGMISYMLASSRSSNRMRTVHAAGGVLIVASVVLGAVFSLSHFKVQYLLESILAFIPTFWGILSIGVAWKPLLDKHWMSKRLIRGMAWVADAAMGYVIFAPVAFFSYFPFVSPLQTRILFNTEFSRGMEISVLLSGNRPVTS